MNKYTDEQKELVITLRKQGFTYEKIAIIVGIKTGTTVHNICYAAGLPKKPYPRRIEYAIGQKFDYFTIIAPSPTITTHKGRTYTCWECKCDCGQIFTTTTKQIGKGIRKSCGCRNRDGRFKRADGDVIIAKYRENHYKSGAKRRKLIWQLSFEEFMKMLYANCVYCGSTPFLPVKRGCHERKSNGVDRIDSDLGYFTENCVACCRFCNLAKGDRTREEFLEWIERVKAFEPAIK